MTAAASSAGPSLAASSRRHQEVRAGLEHSDEGVGPAGDGLILAAAAPVDVAEQPVGTGLGVRPQPGGDVHGQHDPAVDGTRHRQRGQQAPQPGRLGPAGVQRLVESAVSTPVLGLQAEVDQGLHWAVFAQDRIGELEERVRTGVQTLVELDPKAGQHVQRITGRLGDRETHTQRPFSRTSLLDISKRGERPPRLSQEEPQISTSGDSRG